MAERLFQERKDSLPDIFKIAKDVTPAPAEHDPKNAGEFKTKELPDDRS